MNNSTKFPYPLFAMGFRTFFLVAGLFALILMALWRSIYDGSLHFENYFPINYWHAHEMLLGYSVAVIAGFLLTAQRNWTGISTADSQQLFFLLCLWLYGRLVPFYDGLIADPLIALVDFAFLPCLTFFLAKSVIQSRQYKYLIFSVLLGLMTVGNALIHLELLEYSEHTAWTGLCLIVSTIVVMIVVIAGRIFPFFTERGLKGVIAIRNPLMDGLSIGSTILTLLFWVFSIKGIVLAGSALLAVVFNSLRVMGWFDRKVLYVPLLWVLYLGYAWVLVGFILLALAAFEWVTDSIAIHAFAVGGIGVLTLGMMARVSLGHTGRNLKIVKAIEIAFVFINLAAIARVILPAVFADWYDNFILIAIYSWLAAFSLFAAIYFPILTTARVDGKEG